MRHVVLAVAAATLAAGCLKVHRKPGRPLNMSIQQGGAAGSFELERGYVAVPSGSVMRVTNITYFDLAACFPMEPVVTDLYSDEQLMAALTAARPAVMECLVPPGRRGPASETHAVVSAFAQPGAGVQATVGGDNLTDEGQRCVLAAVAPFLNALKPLPEGWPPAGAQVEFLHTEDTLPSVTLGVNPLSDGAGQIRLALPSWCSCLEPWKDGGTPREIEVLVNLRKVEDRAEYAPTSIVPHDVGVPALGAADQPVAACLKGKLQQMSFRMPKQDVDVPFYFQFIDSRRDGPLPDLPPWLQHKQLEAVRHRRFAELAMALGARSTAARSYDALVKRFQENNKAIKFEALVKSCEGLLRTDDAWAAAAQKKLEAEKLALVTAEELGAPAEHVTEAMSQTQRVLGAAAEVRQLDERACPRRTWGWSGSKPARTPALRGKSKP